MQAAWIFFQREFSAHAVEYGEADPLLPIFALTEQVVLRLGIRGDDVDFLGYRPTSVRLS